MILTLQALLLCIQLLLLSCEVSGLRRQNKQEGLVSIPTHTVTVQRLSVLCQTLPNHPALQFRVEPKVMANLLLTQETMHFCVLRRHLAASPRSHSSV